MAEFLPAVKIGTIVRVIGAGKGVVRLIHDNLGFEAYEIELESGKVCTEARYRFDLISDPPISPSSPPSKIPTDISVDHPPDKNRKACGNDTECSDGNSTDTELYNLDIDDVILGEQNKNTLPKTDKDMNTLNDFLVKNLKENRDIQFIPPNNFACSL